MPETVDPPSPGGGSTEGEADGVDDDADEDDEGDDEDDETEEDDDEEDDDEDEREEVDDARRRGAEAALGVGEAIGGGEMRRTVAEKAMIR